MRPKRTLGRWTQMYQIQKPKMSPREMNFHHSHLTVVPSTTSTSGLRSSMAFMVLGLSTPNKASREHVIPLICSTLESVVVPRRRIVPSAGLAYQQMETNQNSSLQASIFYKRTPRFGYTVKSCCSISSRLQLA
ncbi:hypothetical protein M378DRAFT_542444 [Amanita muscaria Koide BX008]|uniref:Uncharacterized protein n=1 Tax=Amanita muscaria (strain Koide BX008) TaxID=946122 RepID=A0A0C2WTP9_AMAMK|nr:hypothetical protein M378DRAFT_542444 [Amanita muscaria Koide BX008]